MKTANAIKKLERAGAAISTERAFVYGDFGHATVEFIDQHGEAICIRTIRTGDADDIQTDYFAGSWKDNIKQAIELADYMGTW